MTTTETQTTLVPFHETLMRLLEGGPDRLDAVEITPDRVLGWLDMLETSVVPPAKVDEVMKSLEIFAAECRTASRKGLATVAEKAMENLAARANPVVGRGDEGMA